MRIEKSVWLMLVAAAVVVAGASVRADDAAKAPAAASSAFALNGDAAKGKATYDMYCLACHGATGKGDGPGAAALNPKPQNFTDKKAMSALSDEDLYKVIKNGGASVGKSPLMIAWKAALTDQQIRDVAAYVRSLAK